MILLFFGYFTVQLLKHMPCDLGLIALRELMYGKLNHYVISRVIVSIFGWNCATPS